MAISGLINIILLPIDTLIITIFPDLTGLSAAFTNLITRVSGLFSYFFNMFPPILLTLVGLFFTFYVSYFSAVLVYEGIIIILNLIQKLKFW